MDYMKPKLIELKVGSAGAAACDYGATNYSTGCTRGLGNQVNCNNGSAPSTGPGCQPFGYAAKGNCRFGFGVSG
jgi:hypothetical protein